MSEEQRQSSKLLKLRSFNACKNIVAPIIAILGHLEVNTEVLNTDMETVECQKIIEMPILYWP